MEVQAGEISLSTNGRCPAYALNNFLIPPIPYNPLDDGTEWGIICHRRDPYRGELRGTQKIPFPNRVTIALFVHAADAVRMSGGQATPITHSMGGKQYVVIAAGGHGKLGTRQGDYVIAFTLP